MLRHNFIGTFHRVFPLFTAKKRNNVRKTHTKETKSMRRNEKKCFSRSSINFWTNNFISFSERNHVLLLLFRVRTHVLRTASRICSTKDVQKSCDARVHATTGAMSYRCTIVIALTVVFVVCVLFYSTSSARSVPNRYSREKMRNVNWRICRVSCEY